MTDPDAKVARDMSGLIDKTLKDVAGVLAKADQRPTPTTLDQMREVIARALTDALDLGMWWAKQANEQQKRSLNDEASTRTTKIGVIRPKKG